MRYILTDGMDVNVRMFGTDRRDGLVGVMDEMDMTDGMEVVYGMGWILWM